MRYLKSALMLVVACQLALACQKPSGNDTSAPPPAGERPNPSEEAPSGSGLTMSDWQRISVTIQVDPTKGPRKAIIGFDRVLEVFNREVYGSCALCHTHEWPYLSNEGWPRFLESIGEPRQAAIRTKEDLAALVVGCVDPVDESHCAGDPDDPTDNLDVKMPTKFGFEPLSSVDLDILRQWIRDGVQAQSQEALEGLVASNLTEFELTGVTPGKIEVRSLSRALMYDNSNIRAAFEARFSGKCMDGSLKINLKDSASQRLATVAVPLQCLDGVLVSRDVIVL